MELSVSVLGSLDRVKDVKKLNNSNCDYIHIDIMDGKFVANNQINLDEVNNIIINSNKNVDIHLMTVDPLYYINNLVLDNKISYITFHCEINTNFIDIINKIKEKNIKVGIALSPDTDISKIINYLDLIDLVLILSVNPGYSGQKFINSTLIKIQELKKIINKKNLPLKIEIDGGVNDTNIIDIKKSGVDIVVSGSFITNSVDFNKNINLLKN